jgi:hypothetical protein
MKGSKALLITAAMTAGLLALVVGLWRHYARPAAERWQAQSRTSPAEGAGGVPEDDLAARRTLPAGAGNGGFGDSGVWGFRDSTSAQQIPSAEVLNSQNPAVQAVGYQPATAEEVTKLGRSLASLSRLPGGGLPIETIPRSAELQDAGPILLGDAGSDRPRRLVAPAGARALSTWRQPQRPPTGGRQPGTTSASQARSDRPPAEPNPLRNLSLTTEYDAPLPDTSEKLADVETVRLMRWLARPQEPGAPGARAELMRRGFTEVHLELARRLFDPDPEVRKRLARTLPAVQSVDAAPWLLWLSRDPDPGVRMVAIGLIATSGDAALWEQIQQAAREDPDPQIQRQAELMAARRGREPH